MRDSQSVMATLCTERAHIAMFGSNQLNWWILLKLNCFDVRCRQQEVCRNMVPKLKHLSDL